MILPFINDFTISNGFDKTIADVAEGLMTCLDLIEQIFKFTDAWIREWGVRYKLGYLRMTEGAREVSTIRVDLAHVHSAHQMIFQ